MATPFALFLNLLLFRSKRDHCVPRETGHLSNVSVHFRKSRKTCKSVRSSWFRPRTWTPCLEKLESPMPSVATRETCWSPPPYQAANMPFGSEARG